MNPNRTRSPRAAAAIRGAQAARTHMQRTALIARQLDMIALGAVIVRTVPIYTDGTGTPHVSTWVTLGDAAGHPITADRAAHRAARQLLHRMFPGADWTRPQDYDARTGELTTPPPLAAPAGLGCIETEANR